VSAKLTNGEDYQRILGLSFEIVPEQSSFKILATKVIITHKVLVCFKFNKINFFKYV
jgi:hypothetical protein